MITERGIAGVKAQAKKTSKRAFISESLGRGRGSLELRASPNGTASWYYTYAVHRAVKRMHIGVLGEVWSQAAARAQANALANERSLVQDGDLKAHREKQKQAAMEAIEAEHKAAEQAAFYTLKALIDEYTKHLERLRKSCAREAHTLLLKHVIHAWPELASTPARDLTRRQATAILRKMVEDGKGRTAGKVRSFLRAAYALAVRAEGDATAPAELLNFEIDSNPVAGTASLASYNKTRDRVLSESELRAYKKHLEAKSGVMADFAFIQLLTAGQRFAQLVRAEVVDFNMDASTLTLRDAKGRRSTPRIHVVPLCSIAKAIVRKLSETAGSRTPASPWLFSSDGKVPVHRTNVSMFIADIAKDMLKEKQAAAPFKGCDIRRTCETMLAAMGVSRDTRAQIQSHGLCGIQHRHYDRYDYMVEKRSVIESWSAWLAPETKD